MEEKLQALIKRFRENEVSVISLLQKTQETFGYIPEEAVHFFSMELNIPASTFFGVSTFYAQFHLKPRGRNIVTACCGTACHVKGGERLISSIKKELVLSGDENTSEDRMFTLEQVACVGACSAAPVVLINEKVFGKTSTDNIVREIKKLRKEENA